MARHARKAIDLGDPLETETEVTYDPEMETVTYRMGPVEAAALAVVLAGHGYDSGWAADAAMLRDAADRMTRPGQRRS